MSHTRLYSIVFIAVALLMLASSASFAAVFVKWDSPGPTFDGDSWATAYHTVQAGIDDADIANEEVWVAGDSSHPYVENIVLRDGVALFGGFAGTESSNNQRNPAVNVTVLDGNHANSAVRVVGGAGLSTVIDGFTVRNGNATYGGGINCSNASPTITSNRIQDNTASWDGGGLYCGASATPLISENTITGNNATGHEGGGICSNNASPTIRCNTVVQNSTGNAGAGIACSSGGSPVIDRNLIQDNTASGNGGGVHCYYSSPGVTNNIIKGNAGALGGGLLCYNSAAVIANNTFVSNSATGPANFGGGAYCSESTATFLGNIIAFGSSGIGVNNSTLSLSNNCVYGNSADNYSGLSPGPGDISQDPLFVDRATGDYHLTPISPCIDAGTNSGVPTTDYQGRVRPQDGNGDGTFVCDIGAYEYRVVYVKWDSPGPTFDGKSWATAYHIVQEGLNSAISPDEVWVGAGTYVENITLKNGVGLYGGFAGTEASRSQRNSQANVTIIDGNQAGSVVTSPSGATSTTVIDGFTIRNGSGTLVDGYKLGGGLYCRSSSPTISSNTIAGNAADNGGGTFCGGIASPIIFGNTISANTAAGMGGGILCDFADSPTISHNSITQNSAAYGGGIDCVYSESLDISDNTITGNSASSSGGGIRLYNSSPTMTNNTITENTALNGGGVACDWYSSPGISSNNITGNTAQSGGGIYGRYSSPTITGCQISQNTATGAGGGVRFENSSSPTITNCTLQGNSATGNGGAICVDGGGSPMVSRNNISANTGEYWGSAIYYGSVSSTAKIENNALTGNIGFMAIFNNGGSSPTIAGNLITGNTDGGLLLCGGISPVINNTIAGNGGDGVVLNFSSCNARLWNNVIAFNTGVGVSAWSGAGTTAVFGNNCAFNNSGGNYASVADPTGTNGNFSADPMFVNRTAGDYHLASLSPCINAGDNSAPSLPSVDMDGEGRIYDTTVDIGADEFTAALQPRISFAPDSGTYDSAQSVLITCNEPDAEIHYTTNGVDPTQDDPIVAGPVSVCNSLTLKAKAWKAGWPTSITKRADYTLVLLSAAKKLASGSASIPNAVVTAIPGTSRFYIEADDRSCGILIYKSGYVATPGTRVNIQGTVGTASNGEKWISATSVTDTGTTGTIKPIMFSNRDVGGGDWYYDAVTKTGQKGVKDRPEVYAQSVNNIGMLITTTGWVTYSTTGYFYIDDGTSLADNSGHVGIKVQGSVPPPVPLPPGWTPVGKFVTVTGISTCFKAASPSTDLYRQIFATGVALVN